MKIYVYFITILVITILFKVSSFADELIPIGVSSGLTGQGSTYGEDIKNVILFANEKMGKGRFKLIIEDDKCNGKDAVTAAKKLINIDKVRGVIGYSCSGALLASAPILEAAKIPTMGTLTSAAKISDAGEYIFRTQPSDSAGINLLYNYIKEHHKIFGALNAQTDFCQGLAKDLQQLSSDGPLKIEAENVLATDTDYRSVLLRLKKRGIDGLFLNAQDEAGAYKVMRQAKELGMNLPFYTFYMGTSETFLKLAGDDANGVISVDLPNISEIANSEGIELYKEFIAKYGPMKAWDFSFATTFEAFRALTEALTNSSDPKNYLLNTRFKGIFGPYSFDKYGDAVGLNLVLKINKKRKPKILR